MDMEQQQYQQYQQYQQQQSNQNNQEPPKKKKNGGAVAQKLVMSICMGLLFGVFGGLGFYVVNKSVGTIQNPISEIISEKEEENVTEEIENPSNAEKSDSADSNTASLNISNTDTKYTSTITGDTSVTTVAEVAMPSMVSIVKNYTYTDSSYYYYFGGGSYSYEAQASGSGILVAETDTEYLIVSNNHVVEDPISLEVTFVDGSSASAYIKGCDKDMDVAVIAVQKSEVSASTREEIRIAIIGNSDKLSLGEQVVAIGNALGYGQSVTTGIVSALDREIETDNGQVNNYIQTDAAINPGNSGGALLNMSGEVIGINSAKIGGDTVEGMGYAIPVNAIVDIVTELMEHDTKIPVAEEDMGYIGINLQEITESLSQRFNMPVGIYIVEVINDGAAQKAGLMTGDIITGFAGEDIDSYDDLTNMLKYYSVGSQVEITYMRQENGEYVEHNAVLTLGSKPQ